MRVTPASDSPRFIRSIVAPIVVGGVLFLVALDGGSYSLESRSTLAVAVWWLILLGIVGGFFRNRLSRAQALTGMLLLAFAAWSGLSAFWADSPERAVLDLGRNLLYAGLFVLLVAAVPRARLPAWTAGIGIGIAAVGALALCGRLFPGLTPAGQLPEFIPRAQTRLYYPLNYWNALAALLAIGLPVLLSFATTARSAVTRAAAVGVVPALSAAIYLTSSRGGSAAAVAGIAVWIVLTSRRWAAVGTLLIALTGSWAAVVVVRARPELVDVAQGPLAESQGRSAAVLLLVVCLGTGAASAIGWLMLVGRFRPPRRVGRAAALATGAGLIALVVSADPLTRFEEFKQPSSSSTRTGGYVETHLLSVHGNGRWQHWTAAIDEFQESPVVGRGAGSYEAWWAEHGSLPVFVTEAHSLYLEVLGELGIVGFILLVGALLLGAGAAVRLAAQEPDPARARSAGLLGGFAAFAVAAGVDWMWEVPAVTGAGLACLALALASPPAARRPGRARLAAMPLALAAIVLVAAPALSAGRLDASRAAFVRGDLRAAAAAAHDARRLSPWAASPFLQLALIDEQRELGAARRRIGEALERDPSDWRLWLVAARLHVKAGAIREGRVALARARELNPRSPLFRR